MLVGALEGEMFVWDFLGVAQDSLCSVMAQQVGRVEECIAHCP